MNLEVITQSIFLLLVVLQCICNVYTKKNEESLTFNVQPGGDIHTASGNLDDVTCSFTYRSQGGTNEEWVMVIKKERDYTCEVSRPRDTYLMFQDFEIKLEGAKLKEFFAYSNMAMKDLSSEEYERDHSTDSVRSTGKFKNKLQGLMISGSASKEDL